MVSSFNAFSFLSKPFKHWSFIIGDATTTFYDIPISHYYNSTINVKSDLIAIKSIKMIKIYQKMSS